MSSGPRQQSLFLNVPSPSLVCLVFCCIFQVVSSGSRSATSTDLALVSISLIAPSRLRLHIASGPRPPSGGEMSPTCQPANQRRGPVSKGEIPNLLGLYSRSYPTKPLNHFFSMPPDSSDRLLRGLRAASGHGGGGQCLGSPNSNRRSLNNSWFWSGS